MLELFDVVETPETKWTERIRESAYTHLRDKRRKAYEESRIPISANHADFLVRCHPAMPSPFDQHQPDPKAPFDRHPKSKLIVHPVKVIHEHLDNVIHDILGKCCTLHALRSVEAFEKIKVWAETSPWCFDALNNAAILAIHPSMTGFPSTDHLRKWKYVVEKGLITRPSRQKTGVNLFRNLARDIFFYEIVRDLTACGLSKRPNDATNGPSLSACGVVAEVCGLEIDAVRMVVDKVKKRLS